MTDLATRVHARGFGSTTAAEVARMAAWSAELFAPDRALIDAFEWQDKRGLGFNLQTYRDGVMVGAAHVFVRAARVDGEALLLGCLGGVMTDRAVQGQGVGSHTVSAANRLLRETLRVELGVLLCQSRLVSFYERLGWQRIAGAVLVEQSDGRRCWPADTMVLPATGVGPLPAALDLAGPPF